MNPSTSDCSSGCESGWTVYLDQLSDSTHNSLHNSIIRVDNNFSRNDNYQGKEVAENYEDDYEDLSMVSDASSGPPHICNNQVYAETKKKNERRKTVQRDCKKQLHKNLCLDDTASSVPLFRFSQDNAAGFSHGFSDDRDCIDQDELEAKKKFGFFKSAAKEKSGGLIGRKGQ